MRGLCRKFKSPTIENGFGFPTDTRTKKVSKKVSLNSDAVRVMPLCGHTEGSNNTSCIPMRSYLQLRRHMTPARFMQVS